MKRKALRHLVFVVALGGAVHATMGCSADASIDEPATDTPSMLEPEEGQDEEDAELTVQALGQEEAREDQVQSPLLGALTKICGVKDVVQGISDSKATEFELGQTAGTLTSGGKVSLFDTHNKRYVKYGKRSTGINLEWSSSDPKANIELHKDGGGPIRYGDKVAIRVEGGGFLKYGDRRWGIKLLWVSSNTSSKPYEWEVRGGTAGQPVPMNTPVRLFNTVENDNLVYCRRPWGINLAWAKDCSDVPVKGRLRTNYCP